MEVSKKKHSSKERWMAFILGIIIALAAIGFNNWYGVGLMFFAGCLFARALDWM